MRIRLCLPLLLALYTIPCAAQNVLTYHNDNARTGQNLNETVLNPGNVTMNTFGKLFILPADGKVDAEPLYVGNLTVNSTTRNVVFVASEHDSVYAYDADTGALLWQVTMLQAGETPSDDRSCSQVTPEIGVTATPVIDLSSGPHGTIYAVAMSKEVSSGAYHQRLHALDITTGTEEFGGPVEIQATYSGAGAEGNGTTLTFDPKQHKERASLLLLNNIVYTAWSSHCDINPYTAWIIGYDKSTLLQTRLLNITPNGSEGSVWQSGAGMAADSGNIYFLTANGTADTTLNAQGFPINGNYGNAFMKLSTSGTLAVADYFNMFNTVSESNADQDLGSGGALVLPDMTDSSNMTWHLAVGAGKDRNIYLVNRDNMGKFNSSTNNIYQQLTTALAGGEYGMPAYFNNAIYYGSVGDHLKMFPFINARLQSNPSSTSSVTFAYPGATPSISANGTANGIVWVTSNTNPAVLRAYDAANLATELYNSNQAANGRDNFGNGNKFITPMIANGKVFVGTTTGVGVFGLLPSAQLAPASVDFGSQVVGTTSVSQPITLTNLASTSITISAITTSGDFSKTDNCGSALAGNASCTINVAFTPTASGTRNGSLTVTDSASNSPQTASLSGTGSGPAVSLQPSSLSFGGQPINTTSSPKSVTLSNTGTATLTISSIATTNVKFAVTSGTNACGSNLAAGSNCLIYVTFTPTATGTQSGTLSIADNASGSPQSVPLSGTGTDFSVSASPSSRTVRSIDSTTFNVTVGAVSGFTGTVGLSCSGVPASVTCTFSPALVVLTGSSQTSTLTVNTGGAPKGAYSLTLTGTSGTLSHSTSVSLKVPK